MRARRGKHVAFVVIVALLGFSACRRPASRVVDEPAREPARRGGQIIVAASADVTTFNEYQSNGDQAEADVIDLLFLGISANFDGKLAAALADGRCVTFKSGENVVIVDPGANGLVRVQRLGASPVAYWTVSRNLN